MTTAISPRPIACTDAGSYSNASRSCSSPSMSCLRASTGCSWSQMAAPDDGTWVSVILVHRRARPWKIATWRWRNSSGTGYHMNMGGLARRRPAGRTWGHGHSSRLKDRRSPTDSIAVCTSSCPHTSWWRLHAWTQVLLLLLLRYYTMAPRTA
jgi:hypothetical protein